MRGTQLVQFHPSEPRFIPAGAGNTSSSNSLIRLAAVYPRWRGEHHVSRTQIRSPGGLSPLARGTLSPSTEHLTTCRFIPAGAGNTHGSVAPPRAGPVYPRWRGEHATMLTEEICNPGLSPLARGTRQQSAGRWLTARFIPAGAGNSGGSLCLLTWITVYPRWRGEHRQPPDVMNSRRGLSPLARGTRPRILS